MKTVVHITTVHNAFDNRIFYKECVGLAGKGYRVILIAPHDKKESVEGVRIEPLKKPGKRFIRFFVLPWQALKQANNIGHADIFHFHDPELILVGLLLKIRKRKKVVYDLHEDYGTAINQKEYIPRWLRSFIAASFCRFEEILTGKFTLVLAEKYYAERFPGGVTVLNYPKISQFKEMGHDRNAPTCPNLIYTGNVTEDRGALIHAAIVKYIKDARVTFIGQCSEAVAEKIAAAAGGSKRIEIAGVNSYIPFTEIMDYYQKGNWTAGLAIFPPTPHYLNKELTKLFEYMGAGIPVICSDFPVWKGLVEDTGCGICVNPGDSNEVCEAIRFLVDNPDQAKQMGERGRKAVLDKLNWENELAKLDALYQDISKE